MAKEKKSKSSMTETLYNVVGALLPGCDMALNLAELGQKRPLSLKEKFVLKYNSPLCLHCNCKRDQFNREKAKLREIEEKRKSGA